MRTDIAPAPIRLADYQAYPFEIVSTHLTFDLDPERTVVTNAMEVERTAPGPLRLDGDAIELISVSVDGRELARRDYRLDQTSLTLDLPDRATVEIITACAPAENTTLMGLYVSGGRFCTQCEAEGFRRITFFPDRPDVMSVFRVRIEAPSRAAYPYLLSNGNLIDAGELPGGGHYAVWTDPFPKPAYLFALVAGQFDVLEDSFTTQSGKRVPLSIYVDPGDAGRASYAMDALKRAMRWDEVAYGREYDLDRFMIVAVRDFNFGAMENKGLNIFNSSLLLADARTATDANYERIESVVAHEYFHNWTGNRITLRDWFQLCLKEGFTVYRDQQFSADQRGATVQRIKDVRALRARQFAEDGGPLSHAVRPDSYLKIDNFYTATIYEKGAEIIRMIATLVGEEKFRAGADRYFADHDGRAATVEDFIESFQLGTGEDLSAFARWYAQAGTPHVRMTVDPSGDRLNIVFDQLTSPTPGQPGKAAQILPIRWQVVGDDGALGKAQLSVMRGEQLEVSAPRPDGPFTISAFQDFSAPVVFHGDYGTHDLIRLMAADPNGFNRWEAGQSLARDLLSDCAAAIASGEMPAPNPALRAYARAQGRTLASGEFEPAYKALALSTPTDGIVIQAMSGPADPIAVTLAGDWLRRAVADANAPDLIAHYHDLATTSDYSPDAAAAGRRALRNRCLALLADGLHPQAAVLATSQLESATNLTDELAALVVLVRLGGRRVDHTLQDFYDRWSDQPLVIDKWYAVQAGRHHPDGVEAIAALTRHDSYDARNPNRVRALLGAFAMTNPHLFHAPDGSGYRFFTDQVIDMDGRNPQVAARLLGVFEVARKLDAARQALIEAEISRVLSGDPSKNVIEIAERIRG